MILHSAHVVGAPLLDKSLSYNGHHTTVLVLIAASSCPFAYQYCFVFKTLSLSLYLENTIYETKKRGDLCICIY